MLNIENKKRWYYVSFEMSGKIPSIVVGIYDKNIDELNGFLSRPIGSDLFFERDLSRGFGNDSVLKAEGSKDGYLRLRALCDMKQSRSRNVSEAFSELFSVLSFAAFTNEMRNMRYDEANEQLLCVRMGLSHYAPIGGETSVVLTKWVQQKPVAELASRSITDAVRATWNGYSEFKSRSGGMSHMDIGLLLNDKMKAEGGFVLQTIGNACDISPHDWWERMEGHGHELVPHNVDHPMQQLSLLAGLAALVDLARKDIDRSP